jgi:hypothetical protein
MHVISARNVHAAFPEGIALLRENGIPQQTRGGECIVLPYPCTTVYRNPCERVLFWGNRDANPFFHFFEGLWMLAGRDDVAFLAQYVKRIATYSDDGVTLHGAYGHRWRYPSDQLRTIVDLLREYPKSRRAVLTMWGSKADLFANEEALDVPCNTQVYFWRAQGAERERLHMTVTCRSNDIIWGAYGANAVHFSMLQEYVAAHLGLGVGYYWQVSNNYHAYKDVLDKLDSTANEIASDAWRYPYEQDGIEPYPMVEQAASWDEELQEFFAGKMIGYNNSFFSDVAVPLRASHVLYKKERMDEAQRWAQACKATDWKLAVIEWLERRGK